jgi:hypothetical protein
VPKIRSCPRYDPSGHLTRSNPNIRCHIAPVKPRLQKNTKESLSFVTESGIHHIQWFCLNLVHHLLTAALAHAFVGPIRLLADGVAHCREAEARMADSQDQDGDDDHHTLENNKLGLIAHEIASPSTSELRNTVDASDEDAHECDEDGETEGTELLVVEELGRLGGKVGFVTVAADDVVDDAGSEDAEDNNLEDDTGDH